jgi:hypothetical protein
MVTLPTWDEYPGDGDVAVQALLEPVFPAVPAERKLQLPGIGEAPVAVFDNPQVKLASVMATVAADAVASR